MNEINKIWQKILEIILEKVGESTFELWFSPIKLLDIKNSEAFIEVPNRFFKDWIEDNFPSIISDSFYQITGSQVEVKYIITGKEHETGLIEEKKQVIKKGNLNPKYTFDTFVVGPSNQFAHAASFRVAENPGFAYNPLFIYGGVGLGKTHLITAIGNYILDKKPEMNVCYISSEQFTGEFVSAIRHEKMPEFRNKYRTVDVFLVDDIQFIAGKDSTQEEFFHTFNELYSKQKQIVISSDRPPMEISDITDRLRSRFGMGLIADIQPPEIETRLAILYKKADMEGVKLPEDVAYFIASRVKSNVRELEGSLIKLCAYTSLTKVPISMDVAKYVLRDLLPDENKPITIELIQKAVCEAVGLKIQDIKSKKRTKEISNARKLAMYITKKLTNLSLAEIGNAFGGKDHATVIYACKQVEKEKEKDESISRLIDSIIKKVTGQ
ncbi:MULTISPECIES: chromosomal replication initiator protein DnaA [Thermodesulfovibrio]|uniref:Chromosomal replication initiator protein DnaA n=1 Tax=Thermodesulfovibrio yellowstonii (strain ATCC 51303 / DSM 11347 / YP87) TaxID=289376 RepID=DNAA_THEYD|nr:MULTISPECIES: chromosomal replication initiator protein DnaA [Thermodesulfovibrio]B5YGT9.1 RecName: Full=Chromosomal replication initiator protein DnaA [Thermodesulfovibrio yellowstonii DSM 11347]ACI20356.1 chromosomal replication initiator protein DnaA [Thermodesulfovibrio yellowstonii DSM 11347]